MLTGREECYICRISTHPWSPQTSSDLLPGEPPLGEWLRLSETSKVNVNTSLMVADLSMTPGADLTDAPSWWQQLVTDIKDCRDSHEFCISPFLKIIFFWTVVQLLIFWDLIHNFNQITSLSKIPCFNLQISLRDSLEDLKGFEMSLRDSKDLTTLFTDSARFLK